MQLSKAQVDFIGDLIGCLERFDGSHDSNICGAFVEKMEVIDHDSQTVLGTIEDPKGNGEWVFVTQEGE